MLNGNHRHKLVFILTLFWSLLAVSMPGAGSADDLDKSRQQLEAIEQRLEKTLADIVRKESVENDVLKDLSSVDRQLAGLKKRVAKEKQRLKKLDKSIAGENVELKQRKIEVEQLQTQVQKRLVSLYKSEEAGVLKTLFSSQNISGLLEDYDYLDRVVKHDRELLVEFRKRVERRQSSLTRLSATKKNRQRVAHTLKTEEAALKRTSRLKKRYLAVVRKDRSALDQIAYGLKARAESLTILVSDLESGGTGDGQGAVSLFHLQKGTLPWPVEGRIKTAFGKHKHAELGTLLENHGVDIFANESTGVKAVWAGRIAFAKRFQGYGNLIIIDHGGGYYTLYAQVQKLLKKTDETVEKGDLIAYTGFENADYVYFEVRKGRTPIDPLLWIKRR